MEGPPVGVLLVACTLENRARVSVVSSRLNSERERNVPQRRRHGGPGPSLSEKEEAMHKEA